MMLSYVHHFRGKNPTAFQVNAVDWHGMTALMYAIQKDHAEVVNELFEHKAQGHHPDPDIINEQHFGFSALHYACQSLDERVDAVRTLCQNRAELNLTDDFGFTPLHLASMNGHLQIIKIMFNYNTNASAVTEKVLYNCEREDKRYGMGARHGGDTALHLAAAYGHINVVVFLLKKGAEAEAENVSLERNPLHHAFETLAALDRLCEELEEDLQGGRVQAFTHFTIQVEKSEKDLPVDSDMEEDNGAPPEMFLTELLSKTAKERCSLFPRFFRRIRCEMTSCRVQGVLLAGKGKQRSCHRLHF